MKIKAVETGIFEVQEGTRRKLVFRWLMERLSTILPSGSSLVDLGAGPCIFAKIAAEYEFKTTAVDGRTTRLPDDLGSVNFVQANVTEFDSSGFDVVVNLGLLYHLTLEDQIFLLEMVGSDSVFILDTQVHIPDLVQIEASKQRGFDVRNLIQRDGYTGVLFPEVENPMASIGNATSWWHTQKSLLRMLADCGFVSGALIDDPYVSKYGGLRWILASKNEEVIQGLHLE